MRTVMDGHAPDAVIRIAARIEEVDEPELSVPSSAGQPTRLASLG
jgi:hypothetical protein